MTRAAQRILDEARTLSAEEREEIAHSLLESLAAERDQISPEWREEVTRPLERIEQAELERLDGDKVGRELRERFPKR